MSLTPIHPLTSESDQAITPPSGPIPPRWRLPALGGLLLVAGALNVWLALSAPPADSPSAITNPFLWLWAASFLPYLAACFIILKTTAPTGRRRSLELALLLGGALLLRLILLPVPPNLSHDSWRYLWDARVTLQGYSPYVYPPSDPHFAHFQDAIFANSRFRTVPTIYPPVAQAVYLLSYLLAPSNLLVLKTIFVLCDLVTCLGLVWLLKRRGLDPARVLLYAWCPLPILEFAIQGHVDALTVTWIVLALITAGSQRRGFRVLTGFLVALATLTKIYPILLLAVVVRRRDWPLLLTCFATLVVAYIPYLILGHGQVLGFFATYASEQTPNAGPIQLLLVWLGARLRLPSATFLNLKYLADLLIVGLTALWIWRLRLRGRLSMEAATLALIGVIFAVSSHIFPWYMTALLPWIAFLVVRPGHVGQGLSPQGLAIVALWYCCCVSLSAYFFAQQPDWSPYYIVTYVVTLLGLFAAAIVYWHKSLQKASPRNVT